MFTTKYKEWKAERGVGAVETQVREEGTVTGRFREALEKETCGCVLQGEDICPGRSRGAGPLGGGHILSRASVEREMLRL